MNKKDFLKNIDLYVITDRHFKQDHLRIAQSAIEGEAKIVQFREKEFSTRKMVEMGKKLKEILKGKALFIINDRIDIALAVDADGVHLGQDDMPLNIARNILGNKIIGVSVNNAYEARKAEQQGADYLGVGSIFPTSTKSDIKLIGLNVLKDIRKIVNIPIVAIGGINEKNIDRVIKAGADSAAVISAIANSDEPAHTVKNLREKIIQFKKRQATL
jgi:thiamine-phosphate pyrophosphorylase